MRCVEDSQGAAPACWAVFGTDPAFAEQKLGGKTVQLFERGYREIVSLPSALSAYRVLQQDGQDPRR